MPKYPIDMRKQSPVEVIVSPSEQQQRSKALDLNLTELQRLYLDLNGMQALSIDEINALNQKAKHLYPDIKEYFYWNREEGINQYYKRFAAWFNLRKELGCLHDEKGIFSPVNRVLDLTKYSLDSGPLTLHYMAFAPALQLMASPEQAKLWIPKVERLEITGAYVQTELTHGSDVS